MPTERPVDPNARRVNPKPRTGAGGGTPRNPSSPPSGGGGGGGPAPVQPAGRKKAGKFLKKAGIAALAGLGLAAGVKAYRAVTNTSEQDLARKNLLEYMKAQQQNNLDQAANYARGQSYQDSIARNLAQVQQSAPDLYMRVAAGRALPQGAVVLGGAPREDLLQDLGRAMADGRFNQ